MKRIRNFVKNTFKNIPKENRDEIIKTVTQQLIEKVEDLIEQGLSEQEAVDKTVVEFGSVEDYFQQEVKKERRVKLQKTINHYRNDLVFSVGAALLIIAMLVFINLYYSGDIIWFVVPALAVLFWPLAVLYNLLNKKDDRRRKKDE